MAKKKKTLRQKMLSDTRKQESSLSVIDDSSEKVVLHPSFSFTKPQQTVTTNTFSYTYLKTDLIKTLFVTIGIVVFEFILHTFISGV